MGSLDLLYWIDRLAAIVLIHGPRSEKGRRAAQDRQGLLRAVAILRRNEEARNKTRGQERADAMEEGR